MKAVWNIALSSLMEHTRKRLIAFFGIFSVLVMFVLIYLVSNRQTNQAFNANSSDFVFLVSNGVLGFLTLLATLAVSMANIGAAFQSGEAAAVLARPVRRSQYALGRFLASCIVVVGLCSAIAIELMIVQLIGGISSPGLVWGHWAVSAFNLIVIAAITTLLSVWMGTPIVVAIIGYFAQSAIGGLAVARQLISAGVLPGGMSRLINLVWYVAPKFLSSPFEFRGPQRSSLSELLQRNSPAMVVWAVAYLCGLIVVTALLTERKDA